MPLLAIASVWWAMYLLMGAWVGLCTSKFGEFLGGEKKTEKLVWKSWRKRDDHFMYVWVFVHHFCVTSLNGNLFTTKNLFYGHLRFNLVGAMSIWKIAKNQPFPTLFFSHKSDTRNFKFIQFFEGPPKKIGWIMVEEHSKTDVLGIRNASFMS